LSFLWWFGFDTVGWVTGKERHPGHKNLLLITKGSVPEQVEEEADR